VMLGKRALANNGWNQTYGPGEHNCDSVNARLYPGEDVNSDRIHQQIQFTSCQNSTSRIKTILIWDGVASWGGIRPQEGEEVFKREECLVSNCVLTSDKTAISTADLVIFKGLHNLPNDRPPGQLWMMYALESPLHWVLPRNQGKMINWTATYRRDSTIVTPYAKWRYYDAMVTQKPQKKNYAAKKTKLVAWFVSNCHAKNMRLEFARELSTYIQVDIYGKCGDLHCMRNNNNNCTDLLKNQYKFYLAFENSNCKDYITEKFFETALKHQILPIVMGASIEEYKAVAPHHSFIHVDSFHNVQDLAKHLHLLDQNDELYNEYFHWRGTGEFIKTKFFCRVCSMLQYYQERGEEEDGGHIAGGVAEWWAGNGVCQDKDELIKKWTR